MRFKTYSSVLKDTDKALEEVTKNLSSKDLKIIFISASCLYDFSLIHDELKKRYPEALLHGGSSCLGTMSSDGVFQKDGHGMSVMGLYASAEEELDVGTSLVEIGDDPFSVGAKAIEQAIENSSRSGELPSAIWVLPAPGAEEEIIRGIESIVGSKVPIVGGSSADNEIKGDWFQLTEQGLSQNSMAIAAIYTDCLVTTAFHSGYEATEQIGKVTKASHRTIVEISNQPAAQVYNKWSNSAISSHLDEGGNILGDSGLSPIGRVVGENYGVPYFKLSHPETVTKDGAITLFTDIAEGDEVVCMTGTVEGIVERARNVIKAAMDVENLEEKDISGILMTFCAGCMLTIGDNIQQANANIRDLFEGDIPFLASFTFGEQGTFPAGENCHGNLMISVLLFSNKSSME